MSGEGGLNSQRTQGPGHQPRHLLPLLVCGLVREAPLSEGKAHPVWKGFENQEGPSQSWEDPQTTPHTVLVGKLRSREWQGCAHGYTAG